MSVLPAKSKNMEILKKSLLIGIISSFLVIMLYFVFSSIFYKISYKIENIWLDSLMNIRQSYFSDNYKAFPSRNISIIMYDSSTSSKLNMLWPYDRSVSAKLINYLKIAKAKTVTFDILFEIQKNEDIISNELLVKAVNNAGNVILGSVFVRGGNNNDILPKQFLESFNLKFDVISDKVKKNFSVNDNYQYLLLPFSELLTSVKNIGFYNSASEDDNIKRVNSLIKCEQQICLPSLAFGTYLSVLSNSKIDLLTENECIINDLIIPIQNNSLYVNWLGDYYSKISKEYYDYKSLIENNLEDHKLKKLKIEKDYQGLFKYKYYSAWKLIKDYDAIVSYAKERNISEYEIEDFTPIYDKLYKNPADFNNKFVFVGVSVSSATDYIGTPFGSQIGVINHAAIFDSFVSKNLIKPVNPFMVVILMVFLSLITSVAVYYASSKDSILNIILPLCFFIIFSIFMINIFSYKGLLLNILYPALAIFVSTIFSISSYFVMEGKDKKQVKQAMQNYLSPQVLKTVLENPDQLKSSASQRKELTILFSDIRGFTTFSEKNPPELVVMLLNEYLFAMTDIIFKHEGTLDKFIGDAIMAFWGAPVDVKDHTLQAVKTAILMREKVEELNILWEKVYKHKVGIGIGINTEEVVVGNIGSQKFMDYTVIGDGVNLAARLEGLNKTYKTVIIISEMTYRHVKDYVIVEYLDKVIVKGKSEGTEIYELIDLKDEYKE